jgi:hypothetical protein
MSANSDIRKAKELRATAKSIKDADAKEAFLDAADRLEKRAGKSVRKVGRKPSKRRSSSTQALR